MVDWGRNRSFDHLDVAVGLGFQAAAGADAVQITIHVELEQIGRHVSRAAGVFQLDARKSRRGEVQTVDEGLDEPYRVLRGDAAVK